MGRCASPDRASRSSPDEPMCGAGGRLSVGLMRNLIAVTAMAATGTTAALLAGVGGAGAQESPSTLRLVSVEQRCANADNGRRGESLGDLGACKGALRQAAGGARAG